MLEKGLRFTFRNYSTLFLVAAVWAVTLHLAAAYVFRDVAEVRDIADHIGRLPEGALLGVDADRLTAARTGIWIAWALVVLAFPVILGAARRIVADDAGDRLPSATSALLAGLRAPTLEPLRTGGVLAVPLVGALATGVLVGTAAWALTDPVPDVAAWAAQGLARGLSFALAAPFLVGPASFIANGAKGDPPGKPTSNR